MTQASFRILLQQEREETVYLKKRLNLLEDKFKDEIQGKVHTIDLTLDLPDHLRKTMNALRVLGGKATAQQIANQTSRARSMESAYANTLVSMQLLKKTRNSREVVFILQ